MCAYVYTHAMYTTFVVSTIADLLPMCAVADYICILLLVLAQDVIYIDCRSLDYGFTAIQTKVVRTS